VGSALAWLHLVLQRRPTPTFDRIALIEIRARPSDDVAPPTSELLATWLGPPAGLLNSWSLAQIGANDAALAQLLHEFERECGKPIRPFAFVATATGPLSWQLSEKQKTDIAQAWRENLPVLNAFKTFVGTPAPR
jgi:hypothetical protein